MNFSLKDFHHKDLDFCFELCGENMGDYFRKFKIIWDKKKFSEEIKEGLAKLLVIEGERAGFFHLTFNKNWAYLNTIQLDERFRGLGVGTMIMRDVHSIAGEKKERIRLGVFFGNRAIHFYDKLGYKKVDEKKNQFVMEKWLR